jgi:hypothetical protein
VLSRWIFLQNELNLDSWVPAEMELASAGHSRLLAQSPMSLYV